MSIWLYSGTPGSGKSFHAAKDIVKRLKKGGGLICNFPINEDFVPAKKLRAHVEYWDNSELTAERLVAYALEHHEIGREGQTLVVIDECQIIFNCRDFGRKDPGLYPAPLLSPPGYRTWTGHGRWREIHQMQRKKILMAPCKNQLIHKRINHLNKKKLDKEILQKDYTINKIHQTLEEYEMKYREGRYLERYHPDINNNDKYEGHPQKNQISNHLADHTMYPEKTW